MWFLSLLKAGERIDGLAHCAPAARAAHRFSLWLLDPQYALAPADPRRARTDGLQDDARLQRLQKRIELLPGTGELDGVAFAGHIEDAAAEDIGEPFHLIPILAGGPDLHQHQ